MQISRSVHSEVSKESDLRRSSQCAGSDFTGLGAAERGRGGGGTPDERSRAYAVVDTAKVLSVRGGGVYQREECDSDRAPLYGASEEFCGTTLLGARVLCVDGGAGRGRGAAVYSSARERGSTIGSAEDV